MEKNPCPIESTLKLISGKWKLIVIKELLNGNARFCQILKAIPNISHKVLSEQLKTLEDDGLVRRIDLGKKSPHVEYALTELGESLLNILKEIRRWGMFNLLNNEHRDPNCLQCRQCQTSKYNC